MRFDVEDRAGQTFPARIQPSPKRPVSAELMAIGGFERRAVRCESYD